MVNWFKWTLAPAIVIGGALPSYAVTYLTVEQAQQAIFPGAKLTPAYVRLTDAQRQAIERASGIRVRNPDKKSGRSKAAAGSFSMRSLANMNSSPTPSV